MSAHDSTPPAADAATPYIASTLTLTAASLTTLALASYALRVRHQRDALRFAYEAAKGEGEAWRAVSRHAARTAVKEDGAAAPSISAKHAQPPVKDENEMASASVLPAFSATDRATDSTRPRGRSPVRPSLNRTRSFSPAPSASFDPRCLDFVARANAKPSNPSSSTLLSPCPQGASLTGSPASSSAWDSSAMHAYPTSLRALDFARPYVQKRETLAEMNAPESDMKRKKEEERNRIASLVAWDGSAHRSTATFPPPSHLERVARRAANFTAGRASAAAGMSSSSARPRAATLSTSASAASSGANVESDDNVAPRWSDRRFSSSFKVRELELLERRREAREEIRRTWAVSRARAAEEAHEASKETREMKGSVKEASQSKFERDTDARRNGWAVVAGFADEVERKFCMPPAFSHGL